jgi:hypothetical protein
MRHFLKVIWTHARADAALVVKALAALDGTILFFEGDSMCKLWVSGSVTHHPVAAVILG